jgi:CheY-like chemotaxis protein
MSLTVFMVDDEESLLWSFGRRFNNQFPDWQFEGFSDPLAALDRIRATPPDVLVTDVRMPKMSGIELLVAARAAAPALPVIVVTAYGSKEVLDAVRNRTNIAFLEKPVQFEVLVQAVQQLRAKAGGFSGAISVPQLPDLLQVYTLSMYSGALTLQRSSAMGTIWFERGEIVHAMCGQKVGADAVFELLAWQGGDFFFDHGAKAPERTIDTAWQGLLIEGCRRLDERAQIPAGLEEAVLKRLDDALAEAAGEQTPSRDEAARVLASIHGEIPGLIGAAWVDPKTTRTLAAHAARTGFELEKAALLDSALLEDLAAGAGSEMARRLEDVLFTLGDQLHFLRSAGAGTYIYVATERDPSTNLALVRSVVARQIGRPRQAAAIGTEGPAPESLSATDGRDVQDQPTNMRRRPAAGKGRA